MIFYLQYHEIDKKKWDECINHSFNGNLYACSEYLNISCGHWDALIEDDYKTVMPLPIRKKWNINYVFLPSLVQQLGIFSIDIITKEKTEEFINALPNKLRYGQINFNHHNPIPDKNLHISIHKNLELDLNQPYDNIFKNYSENVKRNLKKCPIGQLTIRKNDDINPLITIFRQNQEKLLPKLPDDYFDVLKRITSYLLHQRQAEIWEIYYENILLSGVLFAFYKNKAIFLFSAASNLAKKTSAMHFLIDHFIAEYANKNMILDFEGSDKPSLYRFYKSFGAIERNYWQLKINKLPWPLKLIF